MKYQIHERLRVNATNRSRLRGLVRDVCAGLQQQMFFWGCDVRYREGNLLLRHGMQRLAKEQTGTAEGSSRYRMQIKGGSIELHSFCVGFYLEAGEGVLFVRHQERLYFCTPGAPISPGDYSPERVLGAAPDDMLLRCRPFVEWLVEYERWICANTEAGYRQRCWMRSLSRIGARPWLDPAQAHEWFRQFLVDPGRTVRVKTLLRRPSRRQGPLSLRSLGASERR